MMIFDSLNRSPILRTELLFQRKQKRHFLLDTLLYIFPIALAIIALGLYFWIANDAPQIIGTLFTGFSLGFGLAVLLTHFGLMLRTLHLASNAIIRDKYPAQQWEVLILTGISAREIIFGKWWAIIQISWREYLLLGFLRAFAVFVITIPTTPFEEARFLSLPFLLSIGFIFVSMTFANLLFTAACGVLTSIQIKSGTAAIAFIIRTGLCILVVALPLLFLLFFSWDVIGIATYTRIYTFVMNYTPIMLSNGASLVTDLTSNHTLRLINPVPLFEGIRTPIILYVVLTWLTLRIAQWRAERFGALRVKEVKGKSS